MKISIITPSYNSGKYIERAIKSVLYQDYNNWEHIVVDGGSTDETLEILKKYPHLNWISEQDSGQSDAMNKGFEMSTGDIVGYLNADDEYAPRVFGGISNKLGVGERAEMVVGNLRKVQDNGLVIIDRPSVDLYTVLNYWPCRFPLNPLSYFYKRIVQKKIGPFPIDNHFTMDYWFLLRAIKMCAVVRVNEVFGDFYYFSNKSSDALRAKSSLRRVRNQFLFTHPIVAVKFLVKRELHNIKGS